MNITSPTQADAISRGRQRISSLKESADDFDSIFKQGELCLFKRELRQQISFGLNEDNSTFLRRLDGIASCFNLEQADDVGPLAANVFDSIFSFFDQKSKDGGLTGGDCKVLIKTYSLWASQYDAMNQDTAPGAGSDEIPVYNVNPHNASYFYWM